MIWIQAKDTERAVKLHETAPEFDAGSAPIGEFHQALLERQSMKKVPAAAAVMRKKENKQIKQRSEKVWHACVNGEQVLGGVSRS